MERTSRPRAANTRRVESSIGRRWSTPRRFSTRAHVALIPILEGYAATLRATGQAREAAEAEERMKTILEGCERQREDLLGFRPCAGPRGELLPVWRERNEGT